MQTQWKCPGCTYTVARRIDTCPMCGALMQHTLLEPQRLPRHHSACTWVA